MTKLETVKIRREGKIIVLVVNSTRTGSYHSVTTMLLALSDILQGSDYLIKKTMTEEKALDLALSIIGDRIDNWEDDVNDEAEKNLAELRECSDVLWTRLQKIRGNAYPYRKGE